MAKEIVTPTTSAITSGNEVEVEITDLPATIIATGLAGAETVTLKYSVDNGKTWEDSYSDGSQDQLTATNKSYGVYSPIKLGVIKSASAGAVGVYLSNSKGQDKF